MSCPHVFVAEPRLEEVDCRNVRFGGKSVVAFALLAGFGFGALLSKVSALGTSGDIRTLKDPTIDMAWEPVQTRPAQSLRSMATGFHTHALANPSAFAGSRVLDVREALVSSRAKKCVYVNKYASLCGDLVVLRPSTALRATAGDKKEVSVNVDDVVKGVTEKLDSIEDKPQAAIYAGGALVAVLITNSIVTSIEALPLLPKLLELVGTGYSAWFTYRYLLKKESRAELKADIDAAKKKVLG